MPLQSWIILGLVQLSLISVCAVVFLVLKLKQRGKDIVEWEEKNEEASTALAKAGELLEATPDIPAEKPWPEQVKLYLETLPPADEANDATKAIILVLNNELEPNADLTSELGQILGAESSHETSEDEGLDSGFHDELFASYQAIREECVQLTDQILTQFPAAKKLLQMLHEAYQPLDEKLQLTIPSLHIPAEFDNPPEPAAEGDAVLQAEIETLKDQLQTAKNELAMLEAAFGGEETKSPSPETAKENEEDEDLKALLQQFTKDSRDMLTCIQKLEQENKELEDKLTALESNAA